MNTIVYGIRQRTAGLGLDERLAGNLKGAAWLVIIASAIGLAILAFGSPFIIRLAAAAYINLIAVVGLQIFMGNANVVNIGHAGFMALGAYFTAVFATPVMIKATLIPNAPFGLAGVELAAIYAFILSIAITTLIGLITGLVLVRLAGIAATILTISILVIVQGVLVTWTDLFRGAQAFFGIPKVVGLGGIILATAVVLVIARLFKGSRAGVQLRASATDPVAAEAMGVDVRRLRLVAWVLGSAVVGCAGALYALYAGTINARAFYFHTAFLTLAMAIVGGMRSVTGAMVGVALLTVLLELIRIVEGGITVLGIAFPEMLGLSGLMLGVVIVVVMCFRPDGFMGGYEVEEAVAALRARLSSRRRAAVAGEGTR
ncbi:branched-chain amino acid ABC transporter permease [Tistrella sp. BH-R2-4]|uniref:Branched-chain amino acid ABC transporter permease n=1 Tax=Tistrella arctica TaxID=3133430 RepID=A0ABU9YQC9_9PROT